MKGSLKPQFFLRAVVSLLVIGLAGVWQPGAATLAQGVGNDVLYTTDADFELGTLVSVNHDAPNNDQLQLDSQIKPFPFINVAASGRGTVVRANTETGAITGEYRTAPEGRGLNPSRTTVDLFGNVWTANREETGEIDGVPHGSAVKIGLIVGGLRVDETGAPDPNGGYLAPPFGYNTCADRNGDGLIRTSRGLGDILDWPDVTDGLGGTDGLVEDAVDECILVYQRLPDAEQARHVSVDADNNVWVGGYPFTPRMFYKLDSASGAILDSFDARTIGCGGYGGLIDGNGVLWSVGGPLLRYDTVTRTGMCIQQNGYGLGIDTNGYIWMSLWDGGIVKVAPDGTVVDGFPKHTYPDSMLASSLPGAEETSLLAALPELAAEEPAPAGGRKPAAPDRPAPDRRPAMSAPSNEPSAAAFAQIEINEADEPLADPAAVTFQVAPFDEWVQSSSPWTPGATITLTIEEGGVGVYSDSQTADGDGNFHFSLWNIFDLQPGQVVTVSDGTTTKTHSILPLYVDGVDTVNETVFGRAQPGSDVEVWVHGVGSLYLTADGTGDWTADYAAIADLTPLSDGGSQQFDEDGDATGVWWTAPRVQVSPEDDWIQSYGVWGQGVTIALTIEDGGGVVYSDTQATDTNGRFFFNLWDVFNLQRGQLVTVSDGTNTKTHTVMPLYVDGINVATSSVSGRAEANSNVEVWVHNLGNLYLTADGAGSWTADFTALGGLTFYSDGGSQQVDEDGDVTGVWWAAPRFQVSPDDDWVQSWNRWRPGTNIALSIEDGGAVVYSDTQVTDIAGNFYFDLRGAGFDLQRGQVVTVSDGINTKTHTVMMLFVDGVDVTADTVFGRAEPGIDVEVWVNGDGWTATTPDGSGNWTADFSGLTDLTYASDGGSQQTDADGDSTGVWWNSPRFELSPVDEWVQSWNRWTPGATITLTIEDGGAVVFSDTRTADANGSFHFSLWDIFDVQPGQVVTVSDDITTKTHTVTPLYVDGVDVAAETVSGRAEAGSNVEVWVHGLDSLYLTADVSGNWLADFSGMGDLTYLSDGGSRQVDDDGDSTGVWWAAPRIQVAPDDDWVQSWSHWTPGSAITLTIVDGGEEVYSDTQTADGAGNFQFNLWDVFDLKRGQEVTVTDGTNAKTHTVMPLYVDGVDVDNDAVFGRGVPDKTVEVWVHGNGNLYPTVNASGNWTADFFGITDLTYFSDGGSQQMDEDGDSTGVWWAAPRIQIAPDEDWVQSSSRWRPGTTVHLTIEDGGVEVYSDTRVTDGSGNFHFGLGGVFDVKRGQLVTVSDGTNTKTHTVMALYVDGIDVVNDSLDGRGEPGVNVDIWVHGDGSMTVIPDGTGNWTADFSAQTDLTYLSDGGSQQTDADGDGTAVWWSSPMFQVSPDDNWVQSWNRWTPGATITLTIEENGLVVHTDSQTADSYGNFNFNIGAVDLVTGQLVTVSDGANTKVHTITNVQVGDINAAADRVTGTAAPGARLWIWAYLFNQGAGRTVYADGAGNWVADFSVEADDQPVFDVTGITFVNANEFDDDGDSTYRRGGPPVLQNRGVAVTPVDNHVWVANSGAGTVTRLDNDGNVLKVIETGQEPTGVAVDAAGKVWATNMGHSTAVRIDPNAGADGLGAVDLTVDLGPDAWPYNYSDMTGAVVVGSTSPQGFWTVVQDSQSAGFEWGLVTWNTEPEGNEPPGTAIVVEARAADDEAGLGGQVCQPLVNGELFSMFGRYIEVRVTLKAGPDGTSPVLSDLRIQPHVIPVEIDIKPGSYPNSINCTNKKETITVALLTTEDFDALSVDHTTVTFEGAREMHLDSRTGLPVLHVEDVGLDGDLDLVFHFRLVDTALTCSSTTGTLKGQTFDGVPVEGTDSVRMVKR